MDTKRLIEHIRAAHHRLEALLLEAPKDVIDALQRTGTPISCEDSYEGLVRIVVERPV